MVGAIDLKIYKTTNNLGGAITSTQITSATFNNLFTNVPKNELVVGEDYYACIYIKNGHSTESMDNFTLWLTNKSFPSNTVIKWGFEPASQTIADKYTAPVGITWNTLSSAPSTPNYGNLAAGESFPIWVWLSVPANAVETLDDSETFAFRFDIPQGGTGSGGGDCEEGTYHYDPYGTFRSNNYLFVDHTSSLNLNHMTVACWFRTSKDYTDDQAGYIIAKGSFFDDVPEDNFNYTMLVSCDVIDDNRLEFNWETLDGDEHAVFSDVSVSDGEWHLGVGTWDGTNTKLYLDGVLQESANHSGDTPNNNDFGLIIGNYGAGFTTFVGDVDEVYIWNDDLTQAEITALYENGTVPQVDKIVYQNNFGGSGDECEDSGGSGGNPPPANEDYKVCIAGDWGCEPETDDVIDLIQSEGYDHVAGVGDNAYESASCWTTRFTPLKSIMNSAYGNHEHEESGGTTPYQTFFGHSSTYFTYKFQNIQFFVYDTNLNVDDGSTQHTFMENALAASQNDNTVTWRIALIHHPWFGSDSDHPYNEFDQVEALHTLFQNNGVRIVCTGHNHNWQRTHMVAYNGSNPTSPTIVDSSSPYSNSSVGLIHVVTGTGGHDSPSSLYDLDTNPSFNAYQDNNHNGVWELVASNNAQTLTCSFVDTNGDKHDTFVINA
jgi:hypothetical protein